MRINQFVAQATGLGRRKVDKLIAQNLIKINGYPAQLGQNVENSDEVMLNNQKIIATDTSTILLLNKPVGYVCSKDGQGSKTIYDLIPKEYKVLKSIGRLDKDSRGLIILTNDGELNQKLSHPSFEKQKIYEVRLSKILSEVEMVKLKTGQIRIDKKPSILGISQIKNNLYKVILNEGRNRQIRRTIEKLSIQVLDLNRVQFGTYKISQLGINTWKIVD